MAIAIINIIISIMVVISDEVVVSTVVTVIQWLFPNNELVIGIMVIILQLLLIDIMAADCIVVAGLLFLHQDIRNLIILLGKTF